MRAVVMTRHGPPEVLQVEERPEPRPGPGEIAVDVRAAGVNFADIMARMGLYMAAPKPPSVVGYEVAGTVSAVGEGVTHLAVGQRVMAGTRFGGYAERIVTRAANALPLPERLTFDEGAAIPVNYATAAAALVRYGNVQSGERVLVHAAAGGVGVAATQIAKARGAEVWGTASPAKHDAIRALGVQHPLDYGSGTLVEDVRRLTNGRGVDVVLDPVGGESFRNSYGLLAPLGRLVVYGVSRLASRERRSVWRLLSTLARMPRFHPISLMNANRGVFGLNLGHLWDERKRLGDAMTQILADVAAGRLRPIVARTFPLDQAADAHRFLQARSNIGKVVLTIGDAGSPPGTR